MLPTNQQIREMLRRQSAEMGESCQGIRIARAGCFEELPGLAFGLITLAWILTSMAGLAGLGWKPLSDEVMAQVHQLARHLPLHTAAVLSRAGTVAGVVRHARNMFAARDCA